MSYGSTERGSHHALLPVPVDRALLFSSEITVPHLFAILLSAEDAAALAQFEPEGAVESHCQALRVRAGFSQTVEVPLEHFLAASSKRAETGSI